MKKEYVDFATLLKNFTDVVNDKNADPVVYAETLEELATACAKSVLKKVIDPTRHSKTDRPVDSGCNPALIQVKRDISKAKFNLDCLKYATENATAIAVNKDGDTVIKTVDKHLKNASAELIHINLSDGLDLINDGVCAILEEIEKQKKRDPKKPVDLERPYTEKRLKRKVYIKLDDSKNGFETVETTPIQEVYKHIRRSVAGSRAMQTDPKNGYVYLESYIHSNGDDDGDGEELEIYYRLPKYSDLGGNIRDFNGAETFENVACEQMVVDFDQMCEKLDMTDRQRKIVDLKMSGYGNTAVATYLGVKTETIETTMKRLQKKSVEVFDLPVSMLDRPTVSKSNKKLSELDKKSIFDMYNSGLSMAYIAGHYNVSKMTISRVISKKA